MTLKERLLQTLTEPDGVTLCPLRVTALVAVAGYHALIGYMVGFQHVALTMPDCGLYITHLTAAGLGFGGAIGAKSVLKGDAPTN